MNLITYINRFWDNLSVRPADGEVSPDIRRNCLRVIIGIEFPHL